MSDFFQTGVVTTLHRLKPNNLERLEGDLEKFSKSRPIGLVLPALYTEFQTPSMQHIVNELRKVRYLQRIVVAVGRATREEFDVARSFFKDFYTPVTFIWVDGERVQSLLKMLEQKGLPAGTDGKGRSCWLAYGAILAARECDVIALHDCDIVNYERQLLARLCYPVAHPNLGFEFCKGYYSRVTDRMHGRVTRLFVTPLVRALKSLAQEAPFLEFLDSFRYPLAGEFAMDVNLARVNRIPGDWGLEVGVLAEVYRNCAVSRVCQVDLADTYEHKHQVLSEEDATKGLRRMATDIAKSLFRTMASEGLVFTADHFRSLEVRYVRMAQDTIARYYADAMLNGLKFDRHAEETAVATFARCLRQAASDFVEDPLGLPLIPNWNRVLAAVPEFFDLLDDSLDKDNRQAGVRAA
ncbi:MAG: glycosyl transferase [Acidobacteriales bacterium]|nr:MAG: glycosyl transferase [Terriglobales bacterium]